MPLPFLIHSIPCEAGVDNNSPAGQQARGPAAKATELGDGWYIVRDGDRSWRVAAAADANGTWLFFDGRTTYVPREAATARGRSKGRGDSGVMAPMPATVV